MSASPAEEPPLSTVAPPESGDACVLWHRRNLRLADNRAVECATEEYDTVCLLFVFDPPFYGAATHSGRYDDHESSIAPRTDSPCGLEALGCSSEL